MTDMATNMDKTQAFMSGLGDAELEKSWEEAKAETQAARKKALLKKVPVLAAAVVLLALIPAGILIFGGRSSREESTYAAFSEAVSELNTSFSSPTSIIDDVQGRESYVRIGDHVAMYEKLSSGTVDLSAYQGELFVEGPSSDEVSFYDLGGDENCLASRNCKWYRLKGVQNLRFLIKEDANGELSAWQFGLFMSFQEGAWRKLFPGDVVKEWEYGCRERLEVLCQVSDAKDIVRIEVLPGTSAGISGLLTMMPVTEFRKYAEELGTRTIEDRGKIGEILTILWNMKDVPSSPQEIQAHLRVFRSELMRDNVETCYLAAELGPLLRYDRKIRLVFSDGSSETLTYSAVSGAFYYYGQRCIELNDKDMARVNKLFGIDTTWSLPDDFGKKEASDTPPADDSSGSPGDYYKAGIYETPAGTLVVCVKEGGENYVKEVLSAYSRENLAVKEADSSAIRIRYVKYSRAELIAGQHAIFETMKDPQSKTGFSYSILAFGINEVYNQVTVYILDPSEENMAAVLSFVEDPDMFEFVWLN